MHGTKVKPLWYRFSHGRQIKCSQKSFSPSLCLGSSNHYTWFDKKYSLKVAVLQPRFLLKAGFFD